MNKQNLLNIIPLCFGVFIMSFLIGYLIFAWTEPSQAPPGGNVYAPINVGPDPQYKIGGLMLNTGGGDPGLIVVGEKTNPVAGACPTGYDWYDYDGDGVKDNGECQRTLYYGKATGNVGIGTTTPGEKLEVNGNIKLSGVAPTYKITNVATPTNDSDVATKGYVDAQVGAGTGTFTKKRVFITSTTYNGNLGGLVGADAKCQARANAAGLGGTWKAILSDSTQNAIDRIGIDRTDNKYLVTMKNQPIASAFELWGILGYEVGGAPIYYRSYIIYDEFGNAQSGYVWTGTQNNGMADVSNCNNWTSDVPIGLRSKTWTLQWGTDTAGCNNMYRLFCIEQ